MGALQEERAATSLRRQGHHCSNSRPELGAYSSVGRALCVGLHGGDEELSLGGVVGAAPAGGASPGGTSPGGTRVTMTGVNTIERSRR